MAKPQTYWPMSTEHHTLQTAELAVHGRTQPLKSGGGSGGGATKESFCDNAQLTLRKEGQRPFQVCFVQEICM